MKSEKLKEENTNLTRFLPSAVTLTAVCFGLYAIRFSFEGKFILATAFVIITAFMDAIDGRLARFLNSTTDFGAQLDSLADFVNFGVAPGFVIYGFVNASIDIKALDFAVILFFAICGAIRLARFNAELSKEKNPIIEKYFFHGIPAPCGASLAVLPIVLTIEFGQGFYSDPFFIIGNAFIIAFLMASRLPTISIKKIPIRNDFTNLTLIFLGILIIGLFLKPWLTLSILGVLYMATIPVSILSYLKISYSHKK